MLISCVSQPDGTERREESTMDGSKYKPFVRAVHIHVWKLPGAERGDKLQDQ